MDVDDRHVAAASNCIPQFRYDQFSELSLTKVKANLEAHSRQKHDFWIQQTLKRLKTANSISKISLRSNNFSTYCERKRKNSLVKNILYVICVNTYLGLLLTGIFLLRCKMLRLQFFTFSAKFVINYLVNQQKFHHLKVIYEMGCED